MADQKTRGQALAEEKGKKGFNAAFPEHEEFVQKGEKDISFWDFEETPELYCTNIRKEKLDYDVYLVQETKSGDDYYLPAHGKLEKLFEGEDPQSLFKIVFNSKKEFGPVMRDGKRKTYASYDTFVVKK